MLAGAQSYYHQHASQLLTAFEQQHGLSAECGACLNTFDGADMRAARCSEKLRTWVPLQWKERKTPRPFGKVLPGELAHCADVARRHGILLDPIWTLSSWEAAQDAAVGGDNSLVMVMTGGGLGLHGAAQRYPDEC